MIDYSFVWMHKYHSFWMSRTGLVVRRILGWGQDVVFIEVQTLISESNWSNSYGSFSSLMFVSKWLERRRWFGSWTWLIQISKKRWSPGWAWELARVLCNYCLHWKSYNIHSPLRSKGCCLSSTAFSFVFTWKIFFLNDSLSPCHEQQYSLHSRQPD